MKFAVVSSSRHKGKTLEVDAAKEMITLVGLNGETMGGLTWDFLVDQILTYRKPSNRVKLALNHVSRCPYESNTRLLKVLNLRVEREESAEVDSLLKALPH